MDSISSHWMTFTFGLLGNIISFMVFLAPLPTFYEIYKKKSTQEFQSLPYVVSLFSAMLWLYYAFLKTNTTLLVTINSVGCFIETAYICFYLYYAHKKARVETIMVIVVLIVFGFGLIVGLTQFVVKGLSHRWHIVGWICLAFSLCVFVAPLGILRRVIRTKSVEYMPFLLSFFLTLSAVMWFFYGLLLKDLNIAIPNVLGFTFGVIQMILYAMYKNNKKLEEGTTTSVDDEQKQKKLSGHNKDDEIIILDEDDEKLPENIIDMVKLGELMSISMSSSDKTVLVPADLSDHHHHHHHHHQLPNNSKLEEHNNNNKSNNI